MKHPLIIVVKCPKDIDPQAMLEAHFTDWMMMFPALKEVMSGTVLTWSYMHYLDLGVFSVMCDVPETDLPHLEMLFLGLSTFELSQIRANNLQAVPQVASLVVEHARICNKEFFHPLVQPDHAIVVFKDSTQNYSFYYDSMRDFQKGIKATTLH